MKRQNQGSRKSPSISWDTVRDLVQALPGSAESTSYGTPAFKVGGKLFVRLHQEGDSLVVRIDMADRAMRMRADPNAFHITDHYLAYPWMLVRLSAVRRADLADLLEDSWRLMAPKRWLDSWEGRQK
jgi:hypothetical protein